MPAIPAALLSTDCRHGQPLGICCMTQAGECDYGYCTAQATRRVVYEAGERVTETRPMCGRHARRSLNLGAARIVGLRS